MPSKKTETEMPAEKMVRRFLTLMPVRLTDAELLERGARLAKIDEEIGLHEAHEAEVKQQLKARATALENERRAVAGVVRAKSESREVQCEAWADYKRGRYYEIRTDTGEPITGSERPLQSHERQVTLPLKGSVTEKTPEQKAEEERKALEKNADAILAARDPHFRTEQSEDTP